MLNLNLNTLSSKLTEQQRGAFTGLVSASFVLYGGGGPGGINANGGGGGGAGMVVSGSIHMVPNVTYTVIVGAGSSGSISGTLTKGEDSFLYGFNQLASIPMSVKAGGGQPGATSGGGSSALDGGASGDGYLYLAPGVSSSYPSKAGGLGNITSDTFGTYYAAGGGGGSTQVGEDGVSGPSGTGGNAGNGGSGSLLISSSLQTFGYYSSSYVTSYTPGAPSGISYALGAAGGGAGGTALTAISGQGGFYGGGAANAPLFERLGWGPGAGGGGSYYTGGGSGNGGDGRCWIIYCGVPKMDVTNATTTYDAVHNRTIHIFNKGTGSFYFNFEKYGAIEGCQ
jgi:hypothetical protein